MPSAPAADTLAEHRRFESLAGMEGLYDAALAPVAASRGERWRASARAIYPGLLAAATAGLAATWLSQHYGAPVMLFALLIGMAFHFLHEEGRCVTGINFASKVVLRVGVALLGARITATQIMSLGAGPIVMVVAAIATTVGVGVLLAKLLGQSRNFGVLSGGAVAICGASAALAIGAVLPRTATQERDTILAVVTVTTLSTIAMIFYPMLAALLGLSHHAAGIFLGGTIHDVAQVVGAGYAISPETGDIATIVKLLRVAMLLPVVFAISLIAARGAGKGPRPGLPLFLIGFAALVVLNSLGALPAAVAAGAVEASRWCLVTAIAALGMKTSFKALAVVGWRPVALMAAETVWIAVFVLAALAVMN